MKRYNYKSMKYVSATVHPMDDRRCLPDTVTRDRADRHRNETQLSMPDCLDRNESLLSTPDWPRRNETLLSMLACDRRPRTDYRFGQAQTDHRFGPIDLGRPIFKKYVCKTLVFVLSDDRFCNTSKSLLGQLSSGCILEGRETRVQGGGGGTHFPSPDLLCPLC